MQKQYMLKIAARVGSVAILLLSCVAMLSVVTRFLSTWQVLFHEPVSSIESNAFNIRYEGRPWLTMVHVVAGFFFIETGPLQFMPAIRNRWLRFHRATGRVFIVAGVVSAATALAFVPLLPVFGTFTATAATVFGATLFLVSIFLAYFHIRRREIRQHREWMIRSYAIGLGIATLRIFLPILILPPLGLSFPEAWDTAVWLGFAVNLIIAEVWINVTRPSGHSAVAIPRQSHEGPSIASPDLSGV
jgi:uncharacterized membrane protein